MGTSIYDAVDEIVTVIKNNWTKDRAPNLDKAWERRVVGLIDDRRNQIITGQTGLCKQNNDQ